jgi:nucleotide-binding universal stress UspA family protein
MYKKMLVLLDGSKLAEVVFKYAQEISGRMGINLELLHVCSPQEAEQLPMRQAYIERNADFLQARAEEIRTKYGARIEGKIAAKGTVIVGYPAEEILKYADDNDIDLIMLSTHGRSGVRIWDIGTVATKVIHAARVPVWLVPTELREEVIYDQVPRRIMVIPLNGSKMAEVVIPHAINIAKQRGAETEMVFLYVEAPISDELSSQDVKHIDRAAAMYRYLEGIVKTVGEAGITARSEVITGNPASALIDYVKNNPAQIIAMATHGQSALSRMIFSSVTESVIHLVKKTPILLVKPPERSDF